MNLNFFSITKSMLFNQNFFSLFLRYWNQNEKNKNRGNTNEDRRGTFLCTFQVISCYKDCLLRAIHVIMFIFLFFFFRSPKECWFFAEGKIFVPKTKSLSYEMFFNASRLSCYSFGRNEIVMPSTTCVSLVFLNLTNILISIRTLTKKNNHEMDYSCATIKRWWITVYETNKSEMSPIFSIFRFFVSKLRFTFYKHIEWCF